MMQSMNTPTNLSTHDIFDIEKTLACLKRLEEIEIQQEEAFKECIKAFDQALDALASLSS